MTEICWSATLNHTGCFKYQKKGLKNKLTLLSDCLYFLASKGWALDEVLQSLQRLWHRLFSYGTKFAIALMNKPANVL